MLHGMVSFMLFTNKDVDMSAHFAALGSMCWQGLWHLVRKVIKH